MKVKYVAVLLVFFVMGLYSCGGSAYKTLKSAAIVYDAGLTYAGSEYKAGRMSEERKDEIIKLANKYRLAVSTGVDALVTYMKADIAGDQEGADKAMIALDAALDAVDIAQKALQEYIKMGE